MNNYKRKYFALGLVANYFIVCYDTTVGCTYIISYYYIFMTIESFLCLHYPAS